MPGYSDPRFERAVSVPADPHDRDHDTPDRYPADRAPQEGAVRVLYRNHWMTWERYLSIRTCGVPEETPEPPRPEAGKGRHPSGQGELF